MTIEEMEAQWAEKDNKAKEGLVVCDPCKRIRDVARELTHENQSFGGHLIPVRTESGLKYMWLTEDGRYIPAEEAW
ncbi:MAG TPA: hypothetical protein VM577_06905 [Anaerovoracaceae bacterium]|nr:hypothetical protein [Anaerovoracaceae bacterium]